MLARRVVALSSSPHFVGKRGRAPAWHPFRYAVYLEWMNQTASLIDAEASVDVTPDLLELALFRPTFKATHMEGDAGH